MAVIKVNHIVTLQDARYCAALDAGMISFCLERGHIRKLAEDTIAEITDWLSGPEIVLDFGTDHAGAEAWLQASPAYKGLIQLTMDSPTGALPATLHHQQLICCLNLDTLPLPQPAALRQLASQCAWLELCPVALDVFELDYDKADTLAEQYRDLAG